MVSMRECTRCYLLERAARAADRGRHELVLELEGMVRKFAGEHNASCPRSPLVADALPVEVAHAVSVQKRPTGYRWWCTCGAESSTPTASRAAALAAASYAPHVTDSDKKAEPASTESDDHES